jgi:hypothetical protein
LRLQTGQPPPRCLQTRRELTFVNQTLTVAVNEAFHNSPRLTQQTPQRLGRRRRGIAIGSGQPTTIFFLHFIRMLQQAAHVLPHRLVQTVATQARHAAAGRGGRLPEAAAATAVVGVHDRRCFVTRPPRLAMEGVATTLADHQPLQQVTRPRSTLAVTLSILLQLFAGLGKQRDAHQRRHGDGDRFDPLACHRSDLTWYLGAATQRPQPRLAWQRPGFAVGGLALVGRITQDHGHRAVTPYPSATGRRHALLV